MHETFYFNILIDNKNRLDIYNDVVIDWLFIVAPIVCEVLCFVLVLVMQYLVYFLVLQSSC